MSNIRVPHNASQSGLEVSQQVQRHTNHFKNNNKQRIGLLPTDEQDTYKRPSTRASRRSRAERTSYLVATGHLNPAETEQLNKPTADLIESLYTEDSHKNDSTSGLLTTANSESVKRSSSVSPNKAVQSARANFDWSDDRSHPSISPPYEFNQENVFVPPQKVGSGKKSSVQYYPARSGVYDDGNPKSKSKFRQTYTEVTLPMKTSPAFEYILKDNKRRNRRCCLWLIYSFLVSICVAIIIFCTVHLALRYERL